MKIAMISEVRIPVFWWWQKIVEELCYWLIKDHNCTIDLFVRRLTSDSGERYVKNEILLWWKLRIIRTWIVADFFNILSRLYRLISFTIILFLHAKKEKYDLIHAHALLPGIPAKIVSKILHIPLIYSVHWTMHLDSGKKNLYYWIELFLVRYMKYNYIVSDSRKTNDYVLDNVPVEVIHNWVDLSLYNNIALTKKYDWLHFLTVARMDRQKNHMIMLEVLKWLDKQQLDKNKFHRNIVGDWVLRQILEEFVNDNNLWKYVTFRWKLFGNKLIEEYQKNHIFVLPSLGEWQPLTILEAFASQIPVIATNVWDNDLFIKDDYNGYLITAWSHLELQSLLTKIMNKNNVLNDLKVMWKHAYQTALLYDWQIHVQKTYKIYEHLLLKKL